MIRKRRVKETGQRVWEGDMVSLVRGITGMTHADARVCWRASMRAIAEELLAGHEVHLRGLGKFVFVYFAPRKRRERWSFLAKRMLPAITTKGGYTLRFRLVDRFRDKLRAVKPQNPHLPGLSLRVIKAKAAAKLAAQVAAEGQAPV